MKKILVLVTLLILVFGSVNAQSDSDIRQYVFNTAIEAINASKNRMSAYEESEESEESEEYDDASIETAASLLRNNSGDVLSIQDIKDLETFAIPWLDQCFSHINKGKEYAKRDYYSAKQYNYTKAV